MNAGTTLTEFLQILKTVSKEEYFGYLQKVYDHVEKVAHVAVRNVGFLRIFLTKLETKQNQHVNVHNYFAGGIDCRELND